MSRNLLDAMPRVASVNFAADFARVQLESDLAARSQVARFGMLTTEQTAEQIALIAVEPTQRAEQQGCTHVGTGRESQRTLDGGVDVLCAKCGASTVVYSVNGTEGYRVDVFIREDGRFGTAIVDECGERLLGTAFLRRADAISFADETAR